MRNKIFRAKCIRSLNILYICLYGMLVKFRIRRCQVYKIGYMYEHRVYLEKSLLRPEFVSIFICECGGLPAARVTAEYLHRLATQLVRALERIVDFARYRNMNAETHNFSNLFININIYISRRSIKD